MRGVGIREGKAMEITTITVEGQVPVQIMRLKGNLDSVSAGYFTDQIRQAVEAGARNILLDFSEAPFMSSVGISALSTAYSWLHPRQSAGAQQAVSQAVHDGSYRAPHLKLLNPNSRVQEALRLAAMDRYLEFFNDEQQALAAF